MPALSDVAREKLHEFAGTARKRELVTTVREENTYVMRNGKRLISFSCNDYLGLTQDPRVKEAAIKATEQYGAGAGASRLVTGNHPLYAELETKLARWKGAEAAAVFGSGYLANISIIPSFVGRGDLILVDRLVHACLLDGAQLSGAKVLRFKHNDVKDCERLLAQHRGQYRHCLIVVDEVYSMDGDLAPMAELGEAASRHDAWLMADGAHALGKPWYMPDIYVGTLSKALASYGGFVCAKKDIVDYIMNSARSFMFSTGLPPAAIAASSTALDIIAEHPSLVYEPVDKARIFTEALGMAPAHSQIVPLILGEDARALAVSSALVQAGYLAVAIRPPTVPERTARLRFAFSSQHQEGDILNLARFIRENLI
ncbi:MAG TPA: 8-amino-7-oxononanoate synthase [Rickettsiales bacterium]|nr:8-amino-7-oxononanoate synthase [Rickettsiales bacterium]